MKDWTDIQAQMPQTKNLETFMFQPRKLPTISEHIIRLLLAGIMAVLGLTRWERRAASERAWRVRRAVTEAKRHVDTLWDNKDVFESWSGGASPHWGACMIRRWNYKSLSSYKREKPHMAKVLCVGVPGIGKANVRDLMPQAEAERGRGVDLLIPP